MSDSLQENLNELQKLAPAEYIARSYATLANNDQVLKLIREVKGNGLKSRLKACMPGAGQWKEFEVICFELVKLTLEESEFLECKARDQITSNNVTFGIKKVRKDIVIPLKPRAINGGSIWDTFRSNPYNCEYLIFDAKNYSAEITHKEIYQMYHYLGPKKGKVGIIFSRKYLCDESAKAALIRIRADYYMVLVLNDKKIEEWINEYIEKGNVRTYFTSLKTEYDQSFID